MSSNEGSRPTAHALARWRIAACLLLTTVTMLGFPAVNAETQQASPEASSSQPALPNAYRLNLLIRTTIIALDQANRTGNYSVLRDLAAPSFQRTNSPARLAEVFSALRNRNLDLSPILFFEPKLIRPPQIDESGMLRLSGFIPTEPERVLFDLMFQHIDDRWMLFAISLDVRSTPNTDAATAEQPQTPEKAPANSDKGQTAKKKK